MNLLWLGDPKSFSEMKADAASVCYSCGVVTDIGGILSHCAVVAREYHIPAVVGTGRGTKTFHDGQLLEVDGTVGVVRVLDN